MKKVLFVCRGNSVRSVIAEALAIRILPKAFFQIKSAGLIPAQQIHPLSTKILKEKGICLPSSQPKSLADLPTDFMVHLDLVIVLNSKLPHVLFSDKAKIVHWPTLDPSALVDLDEELMLAAFRKTCETLKKKIEDSMKNGFIDHL